MSSYLDTEDIDVPFYDRFGTQPLSHFPLFLTLPPELRNQISTHYLRDFFTTEQQPSLLINAQGALLSPPLTQTSHQLRTENEGLYTNLLHAHMRNCAATKTLRIEAQIDSYDSAPLHACLAALSTVSGIPLGDLTVATTVSFTSGGFDFANLLCWIKQWLADPIAHPMFNLHSSMMVELPSFGPLGLFSEGLGVLDAARQYRWHTKKDGNATPLWKYHARRFLEHSGGLGLACGEVDGIPDDGLISRVLEVLGSWHHKLRRELGVARAQMSSRRLAVLYAKHSDMANVAYDLWWNCMAE